MPHCADTVRSYIAAGDFGGKECFPDRCQSTDASNQKFDLTDRSYLLRSSINLAKIIFYYNADLTSNLRRVVAQPTHQDEKKFSRIKKSSLG